MISIFKYETEEEKTKIIQEQTATGLLLVEIMNITEGNFLGFSPDPLAPVKPIEQEVSELKAENATLNQQLAQVNGNFNGFVDQYYIDNPDKA